MADAAPRAQRWEEILRVRIATGFAFYDPYADDRCPAHRAVPSPHPLLPFPNPREVLVLTVRSPGGENPLSGAPWFLHPQWGSPRLGLFCPLFTQGRFSPSPHPVRSPDGVDPLSGPPWLLRPKWGLPRLGIFVRCFLIITPF